MSSSFEVLPASKKETEQLGVTAYSKGHKSEGSSVSGNLDSASGISNGAGSTGVESTKTSDHLSGQMGEGDSSKTTAAFQ